MANMTMLISFDSARQLKDGTLIPSIYFTHGIQNSLSVSTSWLRSRCVKLNSGKMKARPEIWKITFDTTQETVGPLLTHFFLLSVRCLNGQYGITYKNFQQSFLATK